MKSFVLAGLAIGGAMGASFVLEGHASACGACFHPPPPPNQVDTQVTGHRMAFSLSMQQTVLWDQISYSGNPKEFAWVLPVKPGTHVDLSSDAWLAALDASTATVIEPPPIPYCPRNNGGGGGPYGGYGGGGGYSDYGGGGGGCGACGASSDEAAFGAGQADGGAAYAEDAGSFQQPMPPPPPPVQVQTQEVVGPYDVVIIHSSQGAALNAWLVANGFEVPVALQPTIDAYVKEGFDFVALKLAPGASERAMQPVRVVEPGADPSLPLRMVAGGVGANVALELTVIGEGRYHPQNFPDVTVDDSALTYSVGMFASNYETLAMQAMATGTGKGWLTEFSGPVPLYTQGNNTPSLDTAYQQACMPTPGTTCDGGGVPIDAQVSDGAGGDDGAAPDAADDAATDAAVDAALADGALVDGAPSDAAPAGDGGTCTPTVGSTCDDIAVAFTGLNMQDVWVTRMRANLPASALATDLALEAAPQQTPISNIHHAAQWVGNPCTLDLLVPRGKFGPGTGAGGGQSCALGSRRLADDNAGSAFLVAGTALALAWMKRKKKRV